MTDSSIQVAGVNLLAGTLCLPRTGCWHLDAVLDTDQALNGQVTVSINAGGLELQGTVYRGGPYVGLNRTRIVAGAGGLAAGKLVKPRAFGSTALRLPLSYLLKDIGEQLDGTTDATVLGTSLSAWTTLGVPAGRALRTLMRYAPAGIAWRFLPNGNLWVGPETWPDSGIGDYQLSTFLPERDYYEIDVDAPLLLPGTTLQQDGLEPRHVGYVEHRIDATSTRSAIWLEP